MIEDSANTDEAVSHTPETRMFEQSFWVLACCYYNTFTLVCVIFLQHTCHSITNVFQGAPPNRVEKPSDPLPNHHIASDHITSQTTSGTV